MDLDDVVAWRRAERHDRALEIRALDGLWLDTTRLDPVCPFCDRLFSNSVAVSIHIGKAHPA